MLITYLGCTQPFSVWIVLATLGSDRCLCGTAFTIAPQLAAWRTDLGDSTGDDSRGFERISEFLFYSAVAKSLRD